MSDSLLLVWFAAGVLSHVFWWYRLSEFRDVPSVAMCGLTIPAAMCLGPAVFPLEWWLYCLTEKHE